jgi:hypothetical protein
LRDLAIVADKCFELATKSVAVYPIYHEASERRSGGDSTGGIDVRHVVSQIFKYSDQVSVWRASPVVLDLNHV